MNNKALIDSLSDQEKLALKDIYPASKYTKYPDIDADEWRIVRNDYRDKIKYYKSVIPVTDGTTVLDFSGEDGAGMVMHSYEPAIDNSFITMNFPRILPSYKIKTRADKYEEEVIPHLYQKARKHNLRMKVIEISSLQDLTKNLLSDDMYLVDEASSLIDTFRLKADLQAGKLYFNFYDDEDPPAKQIRNFIYMTKIFLNPQATEGDPIVPYNRCLAIFMILYYMRHNFACFAFLKSMHIIMGNFNGLLQVEEMLSLLLVPEKERTEKIVSQETVKKNLEVKFPTLVDMKLAYYKFGVLDDGKYFCDIRSKSFFMNKITYYTFNESFEGMEDTFIYYKHSMVYTFRLLIPDEENFKLAQSIGFIDSRRINWQFWRDNVIKYAFPTAKALHGEDFLVERQYELLRKMKKKYYNFFNNVITDYSRKSVYEPVNLLFNIATIIFALAGVIQVLQAANLIPSLPSQQ